MRAVDKTFSQLVSKPAVRWSKVSQTRPLLHRTTTTIPLYHYTIDYSCMDKHATAVDNLPNSSTPRRRECLSSDILSNST
eukprot:12436210-Prorocentrum_lima.AAC.1